MTYIDGNHKLVRYDSRSRYGSVMPVVLLLAIHSTLHISKL